MTRKLLVVAASGLVLAILLLGAAWAIGGKDMLAMMHKGNWAWTFDEDDHDHGARMTRNLAFDPDVPLTLDAPADLHFVRGDHASMTVSGSAPLVGALRWENNRLSLNGSSMFSHGSLHIEIVAPHMPPLDLAGAGNVSLDKLDQDVLKVDLAGAGNIDANGRVHTIDVTSSGAGNVDLGDVDATDATVRLAGIGNVDINAAGKVDVNMSGAGNVSLHRKPAQLTSQISGIGSIDTDK